MWCHLKPLTNLNALTIASFVPSVVPSSALATALPGLAELTKLHFNFCTDARNHDAALRPIFIKLLTQLTSLRHLHLEEWSASGMGAQDLAQALSNATRLSHLFVNGITVEGSLAESGYEHVMRRLGAGEAPGAQLGEAVAGMSQLTHLCLGDFRIPDCDALCTQLKALSALKVLPSTALLARFCCPCREGQCTTSSCCVWSRIRALLTFALLARKRDVVSRLRCLCSSALPLAHSIRWNVRF